MMVPVVVSPAASFGPVTWDGAQGASGVAVLNCTGLFVLVAGDNGQVIDIVPPYTRAWIDFHGYGYASVQLSDAGLGAITAPSGLTGSTIYLGTEHGGSSSAQAPFAVGSY